MMEMTRLEIDEVGGGTLGYTPLVGGGSGSPWDTMRELWIDCNQRFVGGQGSNENFSAYMY
jgi:hypothetical protein